MNDAFARRDKLAVGRQYGVPVVNPAAGTVPSVVIPERGQIMTAKTFSADGIYELDGHRYRAVKGDPIPDGATLVEQSGDDAEPDAAPAEETAPKENAKAKGPSETADAKGPSEKA